MSNIPMIQSVIGKTVPEYIVRGTIASNGTVSYRGGIVPVVYMNGVVPSVGGIALMTLVDNAWYVIGVQASAPLKVPAICFHELSSILVGGTFTRVMNANQEFNQWWQQATPANGDSFSQSVYLNEGEYSFDVLGVRSSSVARLDWFLNENIIASLQDWYNASLVFNHTISTTVYVPYSGYHTIRGTINGRHASSTGWALGFTYYAFMPA